MKLLERHAQHGLVESGGASLDVLLTLTPQARAGDYVIVHAGYALEVLDEAEALRTLDLFRELGETEE